MRSATVKALAYEMLFDVYRLIGAQEAEVRHLHAFSPADDATSFDHLHMSCWEWTTSALQGLGLLQPIGGSCSHPLVTPAGLDALDLSRFESPANYSIMMFSYRLLVEQYGDADPRGEVGIVHHSPKLVDHVAARDDAFRVDREGNAFLVLARLDEKIMSAWSGMATHAISTRG